MIYGSVNVEVLARVPRTARRILDVGCGNGALARTIRSEWPAELVGITYSAAEADLGRDVFAQVHVADLNQFDPAPLGRFDVIICSHVLEHLSHPDELLRRLRPALNPGGLLLVALPNILFWRQRLLFLRGHFRYTQGGLMDDTHFRFFDWQTATELLTGSGYELVERRAFGAWPGSRILGAAGKPLDRWASSAWPGLFGWQFVFLARLAAGAPATS